jgi:hypothetical protein
MLEEVILVLSIETVLGTVIYNVIVDIVPEIAG